MAGRGRRGSASSTRTRRSAEEPLDGNYGYEGGPDDEAGRPKDVPGDPEQPMGDPEAVARVICLRLLDRRAYSRSELAKALAKRGVPDDAATAVLDRFADVGLIDDESLAVLMAGAQHRERGLARRAVAAKLRQRGIDEELVGSAVATIDDDSERARAEALVAQRLRSLSGLAPDVQARRLVGLLARKGYPSATAYAVVKSALRDLDDGLGGDPDGPLG